MTLKVGEGLVFFFPARKHDHMAKREREREEKKKKKKKKVDAYGPLTRPRRRHS